jgi:hypothetical protein
MNIYMGHVMETKEIFSCNGFFDLSILKKIGLYLEVLILLDLLVIETNLQGMQKICYDFIRPQHLTELAIKGQSFT